MKDVAPEETERPAKGEYQTPELVRYGGVAELTAGATGSVPDVGGTFKA